MIKKMIAPLMLLPLIVGCAGEGTYAKFPRAEIYPTTYQKKMQAAHHWDELAKMESKGLIHRLSELNNSGKACSALNHDCLKIFVKKPFMPANGSGLRNVNGASISNISCSPVNPCNPKQDEYNFNLHKITVGSPFKQAFHDLMISHLTNENDLNVLVEPASDSITVEYDVQVLTHEDRGYQRPRLGTYALLAANIAMIYDTKFWGDPHLVAFPLIAELEWLNWEKDTTEEPVEIIVTTRAIDGNSFVFSDSRIYYVNPGDASHYKDKNVINRIFEVVSQ